MQKFDRFRPNLTWWRARVLRTVLNLKNRTFQNSTWRTAVILKNEKKSPYVSNRLTNHDEIWQAYADWVCQAYQPAKEWIFENPRWRRPPFWKTVKSQYLYNQLTDFDEIWHGDAHWQSLCRRTFKIAILKTQHGGQPPSWKIENAPYLSNGSVSYTHLTLPTNREV